ncbi:ATP-dependent DNA ligase [Nocardioides sp. LHG3406-4]|uniref:ATP-dependent DNA ligase n=1 Tax=Nocardioides sp. LHG3406-4 TaxID=2804575 RepID=UPI003CEE85FF
MLLHDVVETSRTVAATRSRKAKVEALSATLARVDHDDPDEVETVAAYLSGSLRQRRTGLGWRGLQSLPEPAPEPTLTVGEVHSAFEALSVIAGAGSQAARAGAVAELFGRATAEEQSWLRSLVTGEVRQGALDALLQDAVAAAAGLPVTQVRRAAMMAGATVPVVRAALTGGAEALDAFTLTVGRPVLPMLASSAPDVEAAMAKAAPGLAVAIDTKLDGIRIQVHRDGDEIIAVTRSLDDITARLPEVVTVARSLPARRFILDGEVLRLDEQGRPHAFQDTASRTASSEGEALTPYFFDLLHLDGRDLVDEAAETRLRLLDELVPEAHRTRRLVTDDADAAAVFVAGVLADGHEGVVVKDLRAPYDAGRRGSSWVKVKPVHTLDLVVLAVEWGSGRRRGWLSNIHMGARDPESGDLVMVGKTFKGMTDEMLAWQTTRFQELETGRSDHVVTVRPEQVVEIALDGVQRSTRYPGGVALRFARVVRYRDDKRPDEADTIETVRAMLPGQVVDEA